MASNDVFESGTSGKASDDATARAKAIATGANWWCSRVKAWVNSDKCVGRYVEARDTEDPLSPCLQCATLTMLLRAIGQRAPVFYVPEEAQPAIQQEGATMTKPAKKGTPDPIIEEAKAGAKLEKLTAKNPFAGWKMYDPKARRRAGLKLFATITGAGVFSFSSLATEELNLKDFQTVDVFCSPDGGKIGLRLRADLGGALALTLRRTSKKNGATISGVGVVNEFNLEKYKGCRCAVEQFGADLVLIPGEGGQA